MLGILERVLDNVTDRAIPRSKEPVMQRAFAKGEESRFKTLLLKEKVTCKVYEDVNTRTIAIRPDEFPRLRKRLSDAGMLPNVWLDAQVSAVEKAGKENEEGWFRFVTKK